MPSDLSPILEVELFQPSQTVSRQIRSFASKPEVRGILEKAVNTSFLADQNQLNSRRPVKVNV